jgi:predicted peptidase
MIKLIYLIMIASLAITTGCRSTDTGANPAASSGGKNLAKQWTVPKPQQAKVQYLLFLPQGYGQNLDKRWPLILFLHGAGERGNDVSKVASHGPPEYVNTHPDFPFIVVSPLCPDNLLWSKDILLGLLDDITNRYAVDSERVYLTGLSMGGYGTWELGCAYPERFAAIVPVCGGGDLLPVLPVMLANGGKGQALKTLGVWAFHGGKDPVVPTEESERMVNWLKLHGAQDVKLTIYPEAGHDAWTETYSNPELYQWLLQHERHGTASKP